MPALTDINIAVLFAFDYDNYVSGLLVEATCIVLVFDIFVKKPIMTWVKYFFIPWVQHIFETPEMRKAMAFYDEYYDSHHATMHAEKKTGELMGKLVSNMDKPAHMATPRERRQSIDALGAMLDQIEEGDFDYKAMTGGNVEGARKGSVVVDDFVAEMEITMARWQAAMNKMNPEKKKAMADPKKAVTRVIKKKTMQVGGRKKAAPKKVAMDDDDDEEEDGKKDSAARDPAAVAPAEVAPADDDGAATGSNTSNFQTQLPTVEANFGQSGDAGFGQGNTFNDQQTFGGGDT